LSREIGTHRYTIKKHFEAPSNPESFQNKKSATQRPEFDPKTNVTKKRQKNNKVKEVGPPDKEKLSWEKIGN